MSRRVTIVGPENGNNFNRKRTRYNINEDYINEYPSDSHHHPPIKRVLQSSIVMPTIETKSRAEIISELKKSEKKEDTVRNRRLFSNLIVGTLEKFQKEEKVVKNTVQVDKQREIENRLQKTEQEERERQQREKEEMLNKKREKELEMLRLKRERAIIKYAEEKEQHFLRLKCFIQTQTKPPIFFLPAKHTLRTLELLKESAKKVEALILLRREEMKRELNRDRITNGEKVEDEIDDEGEYSVKSAIVAVVNNNNNINDNIKKEVDNKKLKETST